MPSSPPPSPPSRPVPPLPASTAADPPPPESDPTTPPPAIVVDPEAEIDASTLRFLAASFRALFLPWLVRLVLFTSAAKLVRFTAPYLLAALGWTFRHFGAALSWVVRASSRLALWAGLIATAVWILAGCVGAVAYVALRLRPEWRTFKRQQPVASYGLRCGAQYGTAWVMFRLVLRLSARWCTRLIGVVALALEAWSFTQRRRGPATSRTRTKEPVPVAVPLRSRDDAAAAASDSRSTEPRAQYQAGGPAFFAAHQESASTNAPSSSSSPSHPIHPADSDPSIPNQDGDDDDGGATADGDLAEKWARRVREEMLRESLLAQGKKRTTTTASTSQQQQQSHESVSEDVDLT